MSPAFVRVGDHMPEPVYRPIDAQRSREAFAVRKVSWSVEEYLALRDRFADAAMKLSLAVNNESFAGVRSAYLDLQEIVEQANQMNIGLMHAIEQAQQEYKR